MLHSDPSVVDNATAEVHSAWNFKIPVFWRSNSELWFKQFWIFYVSYYVRLHQISSCGGGYGERGAATRKWHYYISTLKWYVRDFKRRLIERFSESEELRLKKLLRPSHLLFKMRELASGKVNLACMVNKITEIAGFGKDNFGCIASTDRSQKRNFTSTNTDSPFEKLKKQFAALTLKVENLTKNRERSRSRNNHA